jgi:son of sevenless-like protein
MNAIVTALVSNVIKPTDPVWSHVHKKSTLDVLVSLRDARNSFTEYKQLHMSFEGPCVPFVGMYLLEINEVHEDFPDMVYAYNGTPMINFSKRQKWAAIVEEMLRFQAKSYPFVEVPFIMGFIEANLHNSEQDPRPVHSRSREPLDVRAFVEAVWTRK